MLLLAVAVLLQGTPAAGMGRSPPVDTAPPAAAGRDDRHHRRHHSEERRRPVTPDLELSAFASGAARDLVRRAQKARIAQDSALQAYDATAYQRISAGMSFTKLGRERLIYRSESASRVQWQRGAGAEVEILGSRTALPALTGIKAAVNTDGEDLTAITSPLPYYPGREVLWIGSDRLSPTVNDHGIVHPLALGAEAYYTYAIGDSSAIRLPGGTVVPLVELRVRARQTKWNVVVGALWFDRRTAQLVRAVYRLSEPMDMLQVARDEGDSDVDSIPLLVKPLITPMRANLRTVAIEFGLYKERFWLPRLQQAEGEAEVSFMRIPFKAEERFEYSDIRGLSDPPLKAAALIAIPPTPEDSGDAAKEVPPPAGSSPNDAARQPAGRDTHAMMARHDSLRALRRARRARECARTGSFTRTRDMGDSLHVRVRIPCDTAALGRSAALPGSIFDPADEVFGDRDLADLRKTLDLSLQPGWSSSAITLEYGLTDGYLRYNRVEGLSLGAGVRQSLGGGYIARGTGRIGLADQEPNAEFTLGRTDGTRTVSLGVYHRLGAANDWGNPLGFASSVSALLFGRDEGFYYRASGVELTAESDAGSPLIWRFFAERDNTAVVETQFAVAHRLSGGTFPPNIRAASGGVVGASLRRTGSRGLDPNGFRLLSDFRAETAVGAYGYGRAALDLTATRGLASVATLALTGGAGGSGGAVPSQRLWYLGGTQTVRGEPAGAQIGDSYWLGRLELGTTTPVARPGAFYDVGWAGSRDAWSREGRPMRGAGIGASFADGLVRVDLARGLAPVRQWRADLYVEARF